MENKPDTHSTGFRLNNILMYSFRHSPPYSLLFLSFLSALLFIGSPALSEENPLLLLYAQNAPVAPAVNAPAQNNRTLTAKHTPEKFVQDFTAASDSAVKTEEILSIYSDLFQITYNAAPDIRIARARKKQKSAERYTAWAKRLAPAVDARLSQVHEFNMDSDPGVTGSNPKTAPSSRYTDGEDYQDWGLRLDLPIYRRPESLRIDIAGAEEDLAENNLIIKTQELDLRLRELLSNYLTASYRLLNLRNSVRLYNEHVDKIYRGYELRDQTRLQLLRAQANLKELEARRDLDEQRRDAVFRELLDYTGLQADHQIFLRLRTLLTDEVSSAGCINSLADLERSYPRIQHFVESAKDVDLRQYFLEHSLLYQKIRLERNLADNRALTYTQNEWPGLSVRGLYDRREDTEFSQLDGEGSLALVFSIPLFTGGTIFSNTKTRAMAQQVADVTQFADLRATVHALENNRKLIDSLDKVYTTQQIHLKQQREIVVLSLKSYAIKQTSMQDLLTSQNRLIDAKNALMETTNKLGTLYRQFAWQLGTPYPVPKVPVPKVDLSSIDN